MNSENGIKKQPQPKELRIEVWGIGRWGSDSVSRARRGIPAGVVFRALDNDNQNLICSPLEEKAFYRGPESLAAFLGRMDTLVLVAELGGAMAAQLADICREASGRSLQVMSVLLLPPRMDGDRKMKRAAAILQELEAAGGVTLALDPERFLGRARADEALDRIFALGEQAGATALQALLGSLRAEQPARRTIGELAEIFPSGSESASGEWEGNGVAELVPGAKQAFTRMKLFSRERIKLSGLLACIHSRETVPVGEFRALLKLFDELLPSSAQRLISFSRFPAEAAACAISLVASFPRHAGGGQGDDFPLAPAAATQATLDFEKIDRGLFAGVEPNLVGGEDLDIPTFIRRGEPLG